MKLVEQRVKAGKTETVTPLEQFDEGTTGPWATPARHAPALGQ